MVFFSFHIIVSERTVSFCFHYKLAVTYIQSNNTYLFFFIIRDRYPWLCIVVKPKPKRGFGDSNSDNNSIATNVPSVKLPSGV